jgi:hypothetical protein
MTENLDLNQALGGPQVVASPPAVAATGSSISPGSTVSPGGGYPRNPAEPPAINSGPAGGQPQQASTFSQGIFLLSPCSVCGIAIQPDQAGLHSQQHSTGYFPEGSNFGNRTGQLNPATGRFELKG